MYFVVGARLSAKQLEALVWLDCREFILNPGATLRAAQTQLRASMTRRTNVEAQRRELERLISSKEPERDRIMTLYRRGHASLEETEEQLADIADEVARLETRLADLKAQEDLAEAFESQFADAETLLARCRGQLEQIEQTDDILTKRQIMELLVSRIRVDTEVVDGRKNARLTINYTFTGSRDCTDGFSIGTPTTEPYSVHEPS